MKILIVAATKFEIAPLLKSFRKVALKGTISSYSYGKHDVDVLITGAGMTATAYYLGKYLNSKYELAINAGVAGSFRKNISPGTVVNVVSDCFADFGAEDGSKFLTAEEIGLLPSPKYQVAGIKYQVSSIKYQVPGIKYKNQILNSLIKVNAITVNTVHGNALSIQKAIKKFNPDIETMEGAAFFFACNQEKIPCIQVRAISNYVERRNKKKWKMDVAVENLNSFLTELIAAL